MQRFTVTLGLFAALVLVGLMGIATSARAQSAAVTVPVDLDPASATGIRTEGLVSDKDGRLYTSDTASRRLWRYTPSTNQLETLGTLPRSASGMAFDSSGNLYMASGDVILKINASALTGTTLDASGVMTFATGVTGANGLAFDTLGRLYASGGATGRIYLIASDGMTSTWASGFTSTRTEQQISTNGLAFGPDGKLYSSNTGSGAIDRIPLNADGTSGAVEHWVTNPLLLGADGITFASNGDLYVAANERNAIVRVSQDSTVTEVASNGNSGPLEFPASPAFSGNALYASNFDIERGANAPAAPGVGASIARIDVGVTGAPLPFPGAAQTTPGPTGSPMAGATGTVAVSSPTAEVTVVTGSPTAAATVAVETPTTAPTIAPALPTATNAVATAVPVVPVPVLPTVEVVPTVVAPGMPSTGGGDGGFVLWLTVFATIFLVTGLAIASWRQSHTSR
jgi:sugar lactone lactonase YvrE